MSETAGIVAIVFLLLFLVWFSYLWLTRKKRMEEDFRVIQEMREGYLLLIQSILAERDRAILDCQAARLDRERAILERDITRAQLRVCSEHLRFYHHALNPEREHSSLPPS